MQAIRNFVAQFIIGGAIGLMASLAVFSFAIARTTEYLLPHSYMKLLLSNTGLFSLAEKYSGIFSYVLLALVALSWLLVVRNLNPNLTAFPYRATKTTWLAWILVMLSGFLFWTGLVTPGTFYERVTAGYFPVWRFIVGLIMITISWWLISSRGFAGDFSFPVKIKKSDLPGYARSISFGGLSAIIFFSLITITALLFNAGIQMTEFTDRGTEPETRSAWLLIGLVTLLLGSLFAILNGLIPALDGSNKSFRERISKARPAVAYLGLLIIVLTVYIPYARSTHHYGKAGLADVVQLTKADYSDRAIIVLGSEGSSRKKSFSVENIKNTINAYGFMKNSGPIPVSKNNVLLIEQFVLGKGKRSLYRKSAIGAIPTIYSNLWMQDNVMHAYTNLLQRDAFVWPSLLWGQVRLAWLAHSAPITHSNRKLLRTMSDAKTYNIRSISSLMLARAWYRFGNLKKAEHWWQHGLKTLSHKNSARIKELDFHKLAVITNGTISGKFRLSGRKNTKVVRVALFAVRSNKRVYQPVNRMSYGFRLVQGKNLTKNGAFRFTRLGLGNYQLGFMLDGEILTITKSMVKIDNNPGSIKIDGKHRHITTGLIKMKFKF